jgi:hypothetical protein
VQLYACDCPLLLNRASSYLGFGSLASSSFDKMMEEANPYNDAQQLVFEAQLCIEALESPPHD